MFVHQQEQSTVNENLVYSRQTDTWKPHQICILLEHVQSLGVQK